MKQYIDHSVFPDVEKLPNELVTDHERADYLNRICAAWDFDIYPEPETFALLREWRDIFDQFPLSDSPGYHTFRRIFGWPETPMVKNSTVRMTFEVLDRAEGREPDPFLNSI